MAQLTTIVGPLLRVDGVWISSPINGLWGLPERDFANASETVGFRLYNDITDTAEMDETVVDPMYLENSVTDTATASETITKYNHYSSSETGRITETVTVYIEISSDYSDTAYAVDTYGSPLYFNTKTDTAIARDVALTTDWGIVTNTARMTETVRTVHYYPTTDSGVMTDAVTSYLNTSYDASDTGIALDSWVISESLDSTVALSYVYTINEESGAVTEYRLPLDGGVTGIAEQDGILYLASQNGLYALDGTDDEGTTISWAFGTGLTSLGTDLLKRIRDANLLSRLSGDALLRVTHSRYGDKVTHDYHLTQLTRNTHRDSVIKVGKGFQSVYWGFEVEGIGQGEVDEMRLSVEPLSRRR